jgi:predicted aspartyl protease
MPTKPESMTYDFPAIVKTLITPIKVSRAFRFGIDPVAPDLEFQGLWDTGATGTSITQEVIDKLILKPIRQIKVYNAHGEFKIKDAYLINIVLPCNVGISGILAAEGSFGEGIGVLIGMDIISMGDFAISNFNNKTTFSFRIPSCSRIEIKPPIQTQNVNTLPLQDRNSRCRCGSGKKYKNCHGFGIS